MRPLVGLSACVKEVDEERMPFHGAHAPYVEAVAIGSGALPVMVPALGADLHADELLSRLDGLLLTGSLSNVAPEHYGADYDFGVPPFDPMRDATILRLIPAALEAGVPLLAICRGFQELNVALGGTLHPKVHEVAGHLDHRADHDAPLDEAFREVHAITVRPDGLLARLGASGTTAVNSLHGQGIDRLAEGLRIEATAPDGLVEAVSVEGAGFALGVQWHPEWRFAERPLSAAIFSAFGEAMRRRALARHAPVA